MLDVESVLGMAYVKKVEDGKETAVFDYRMGVQHGCNKFCMMFLADHQALGVDTVWGPDDIIESRYDPLTMGSNKSVREIVEIKSALHKQYEREQKKCEDAKFQKYHAMFRDVHAKSTRWDKMDD